MVAVRPELQGKATMVVMVLFLLVAVVEVLQVRGPQQLTLLQAQEELAVQPQLHLLQDPQ
jgi:hypothetical protein